MESGQASGNSNVADYQSHLFAAVVNLPVNLFKKFLFLLQRLLPLGGMQLALHILKSFPNCLALPLPFRGARAVLVEHPDRHAIPRRRIGHEKRNAKLRVPGLEL
jgi:hypothetical protein